MRVSGAVGRSAFRTGVLASDDYSATQKLQPFEPRRVIVHGDPRADPSMRSRSALANALTPSIGGARRSCFPDFPPCTGCISRGFACFEALSQCFSQVLFSMHRSPPPTK